MILESIVTTVDADGLVNIAPMGPIVSNPESLRCIDGEPPRFRLRPFKGSTTFRNLLATRRATIHVTDDVELFARAAIGRLERTAQLVRNHLDGQFAILKHCHQWFSVVVTEVIESPPRYEMDCNVVDSGVEAPFFGFNRAKHAVIEAAILATRVHLTSADELRQQLSSLAPAVEKTAGPSEAASFGLLVRSIEDQIKEASD